VPSGALSARTTGKALSTELLDEEVLLFDFTKGSTEEMLLESCFDCSAVLSVLTEVDDILLIGSGCSTLPKE